MLQDHEKNLYDYILPENQRRRRTEVALPVAVAIVALLFALFIGFIVWSCYSELRFRGYVSDLSNSTVYAYNGDGLTVTYGDVTYVVEGDGVYSFYTLVVGMGSGQVHRSVPAEEPELTLDYGNGSYVQLWSTVITSQTNGDMSGSTICYVNQDGAAYVYDTENIHVRNLNNILRRSLSDE